jgi:hypothetical protein
VSNYDWETGMYTDVYHNPAKHGLEIVGEAYADADYSFDLFVVFTDANGDLYFGTDAGCSCPSPFEDYNSLADLTPAKAQTVHTTLDAWVDDRREWRGANKASVAELHAKVAAL